MCVILDIDDNDYGYVRLDVLFCSVFFSRRECVRFYFILEVSFTFILFFVCIKGFC